MTLRDQPYLPLYVQDYLTDEKLNACSPAAQGIYIKIMCILHKSEEYGKLLLRQKDQQNPQQIKNFAYRLAKLLPFTESEIESALIELVDERVMTIEGNVLFQKRMVKDGGISEKRALAANCGVAKRNQNDAFATTKHSANSGAKCPAKTEQNPEYEYEYENDISNEYVNKYINDKESNVLVERFNQFQRIIARLDELANLLGLTEDEILNEIKL